MDSLFSNYSEYSDDEEDYESYLTEENKQIKLNLEELYENKKKTDLIRLSMYNKLLQKIHKKIKITSRQRINNQVCFFIMPEILIGFPKYDIAEAVYYIMNQLDNNGFKTKYIHPNLIIISWAHWVPEYVRRQMKKKTGIEVNSFGEQIIKDEDDDPNFKVSFLKNKTKNVNFNLDDNNDINSKFIQTNNMYKNIKQPNDFKLSSTSNNKNKKQYNPINKYNASNNLIYDDKLLNTIKKNTNN